MRSHAGKGDGSIPASGTCSQSIPDIQEHKIRSAILPLKNRGIAATMEVAAKASPRHKVPPLWSDIVVQEIICSSGFNYCIYCSDNKRGVTQIKISKKISANATAK